mgnify:CR=1 FL=1
MMYTIRTDYKNPVYTPYGGAAEFMYCHDHEVIIQGPAETGKTLAACWKAHLLASKYPGAQGAIVRKSQKSVYGSVLQTFDRVRAGAPVEPYGGERPEKYNYVNGSAIWVGGLDNSDKVLSSERDFIYVNQAEDGSIWLDPMPDLPAQRAGVRQGDIVLQVDDTAVTAEMTKFTTDPAPIYDHRRAVAEAIERIGGSTGLRLEQ